MRSEAEIKEMLKKQKEWFKLFKDHDTKWIIFTLEWVLAEGKKDEFN